MAFLPLSLWWEGPQWLSESEMNWPNTPRIQVVAPEARKIEALHVYDISDELISNFSSFSRALRVITYLSRFCNRCRDQCRARRNNDPTYKRLFALSKKEVSQAVRSVPAITSEEIQTVKYGLIMGIQTLCYPREMKSLSNLQPISKKSSLWSLKPFLDRKGVMRVDGRLKNSGLTYNERHPIIIPENSYFCSILVKFTHHILLHGEHQLMIRMLRQEYYIPRIKNKVKFCVRQCKACVLYKSRTLQQVMSALPKERTEYTLPFTYTGIDFAGPFQIKTSLTRNAPYTKGYVCIFVCFCSKAIHLEVCVNLTAEEFLAAFSRFVGRRGLPRKVFSDNGRNFVSAAKILQKEFQAFIKSASERIGREPQMQEMQWSFIPPHAPHMGGIWESAVKSFKMHFLKTTGTQRFTLTEFMTLLTRVEAVLNSRPLSQTSSDPTDLVPLTPAHLIRGGPLLSIPEPAKTDLSLTKRFENLKVLHHQFCRRWKNEYLCELHKRYKWKQPQRDIQIDDLVVIKDDLLPSTQWLTGRVTETHPGADERIRVVTIKTAHGLLKRPIVKLVVLPQASSLHESRL